MERREIRMFEIYHVGSMSSSQEDLMPSQNGDAPTAAPLASKGNVLSALKRNHNADAGRERQGNEPVRSSQSGPLLPKPFSPQRPPCPHCSGAGWLRQDLPFGHPAFGKPVMCKCTLQSRAQEVYGGANIP